MFLYFFALFSAILFFPLLLWQGKKVKKNVLRLPIASGEAYGVCGKGEVLHLIVLGESTVAGVGARTQESALAGQIAHYLAQKANAQIHWQAIGKNGVTIKEFSSEILDTQEIRKVDFVVIALGANDVFRLHSPKHWLAYLTQLTEKVRGMTENSVILLANIPPVGSFTAIPQPLRFILGLCASALDNATKKWAKKQLYLSYSQAIFPAEPQYLSIDGIHPSELAYQVWGEKLAEELWHQKGTFIFPRI